MNENTTSAIDKSGKLTALERTFVQDQVKLRMGRFAERQALANVSQIDTIDLDTVKSSKWRPVVIFRKDRSGLTKLFERGHNLRNDEFMEAIETMNGCHDRSFVIDFGDSIPMRYEPFESLNIPVFSKSRPAGSNAPIILWTHPVYRSFREEGMSGQQDQVPWQEKVPDIVWRGSPNGSVLLDDGHFMSAFDLVRHLSGRADAQSELIVKTFGDRAFRAIADEHLSRFIAVSHYADTFNVRFVNSIFGASEDYYSFLADCGYQFGDKMRPGEINGYKYHLVLEGNDAGTQINWALSSGSLILMPPKKFHSTTTLGLREWVHYVPLRSDLGDLEMRLDWCRTNDGECRAITENARAYVAQFRAPVEDEINRRIISRYCKVPLGTRLGNLLRFKDRNA